MLCLPTSQHMTSYNDVIKWKYFLLYWLVQGIHQLLMNCQHKGKWCGALMFSLIFAWIYGWVNNREAGDLRCHHAHYDITVMLTLKPLGRIHRSQLNSPLRVPEIRTFDVALLFQYICHQYVFENCLKLQLHLPGVNELNNILLMKCRLVE